MPSVVSRLLTPQVVVRRQPASDADEWLGRLAALATIGQYDGLILLVDGEARDRSSYNVSDDPRDDAATRAAVEETRRSGATVLANTTIRLADERVAATAMVAPLVPTESAKGVLIALRVARSFTAADALTASGVSELVGLDLARETAARRDEAHRREAFALYELARLALFGERLSDTLQDVTVLLTTAFGHDVAQVWLFEPDGALELSAATPRESLRSERMHPSEHDALAQALHQRRLVRIGHGALRPWVPAATRELIVVPLVDGARCLGVLVLGRDRERYEETDEELAAMLGRFSARLVARATARRDSTPRAISGTPEPDADHEWEDEPQLTGS